jgi:hypothetical protein
MRFIWHRASCRLSQSALRPEERKPIAPYSRILIFSRIRDRRSRDAACAKGIGFGKRVAGPQHRTLNPYELPFCYSFFHISDLSTDHAEEFELLAKGDRGTNPRSPMACTPLIAAGCGNWRNLVAGSSFWRFRWCKGEAA